MKIKKYTSVFKEAMSGKKVLGFEGEDEVGEFWVVTVPTDLSVIEDILFDADIFDMIIQFRGGLKGKEVFGIYKDKNRAKKVAEKLLVNKKSSK